MRDEPELEWYKLIRDAKWKSKCSCLVHSWTSSLAFRKGLDWTYTFGCN